MINLLLSLTLAVGVFLAVTFALSWGAAVVPAIIALLAAYIVLARRSSRQLEAGLKPLEKMLTGGRFDQAIELLENMKGLGRWQFGIPRALDGQIGLLIYAQKGDFDRAKPYLESSYGGNWHAQAMLGAGYYRKKQYDQMVAVFEQGVKKNKKASMLWATYAWCEWKRGKSDHAIQILGRGLQHLASDEKLKKNHLALQNQKKMKMNAYGAEWFSLHLEKPPVQKVTQQPGRGGPPHPAYRR